MRDAQVGKINNDQIAWYNEKKEMAEQEKLQVDMRGRSGCMGKLEARTKQTTVTFDDDEQRMR